MILHNDSSFLIYFGDSKDCCVRSCGKYPIEPFQKMQNVLRNEKLVFLEQVHGSNGVCLDDLSKFPSSLNLFQKPGDFLVTNQHKVGIGVLTGDCLPIVFYDSLMRVSAVVHAGWRGAVADIAIKTVKTMQDQFKSNPSNLIVYFGPSAKVCCYKVGRDFGKNLENSSFFDQVIFKRDDDLFFNLPMFVELQLLDLGIKLQNIRKGYNTCTICDPRFCSARRDGERSGRQATIVVLK